MQHDIVKLCADSLRSFTLEKYGIKLKAAHAHELTAAYLGYPSKNAMLADPTFTLDNLSQAKIIVMDPESFVGQRSKELEGLPPELINNHTLGRVIFSTLLSNIRSASAFPPFEGFIGLARFMAEERGLIESGQLYGIPRHHILDVKYSA